jgi:hypothetical protein
MTGSRFIVYAARAGAKSFFEGISDPTFFMTINKILDDGYYKQYEDIKHGEVFTFKSLRDFVVHPEGLDIPDWLPFMKALQAQDNGSAAKDLYWRMVKLDEMLDPLIGSSLSMDSSRFAKAGDNQHTLEKAGRDNVTTRSVNDGGNSAVYLAVRLKKAGRDDLLKQIGPGKRHPSVRAAAIEAGIITPFPSLQLKEPVPTAQKLLAKKGKEWCLQLLDELSALVFED